MQSIALRAASLGSRALRASAPSALLRALPLRSLATAAAASNDTPAKMRGSLIAITSFSYFVRFFFIKVQN
jgi:hypothetical protein